MTLRCANGLTIHLMERWCENCQLWSMGIDSLVHQLGLMTLPEVTAMYPCLWDGAGDRQAVWKLFAENADEIHRLRQIERDAWLYQQKLPEVRKWIEEIMARARRGEK